MTAGGLIFILAFVIVFKIPARILQVAHVLYMHYRLKFMFHYIEYEYFGNKFTTARSGALNDLEGVGLICEIKKRGGVVNVHITGSKEQVNYYIQIHQENKGRTFDAI